jgi:hypothetical protein
VSEKCAFVGYAHGCPFLSLKMPEALYRVLA